MYMELYWSSLSQYQQSGLPLFRLEDIGETCKATSRNCLFTTISMDWDSDLILFFALQSEG